MKFILLALVLLLSACSQSNTENKKLEVLPAAKNSPRLTDEGKFIHDDSFQSAILQSCLPRPFFERKTSYGVWYKLKDCSLKIRDFELKGMEIGIHKDSNETINAIRFMIYPDTEYGQYLAGKYTIYSVETEPKICLQYYQSTFPILTIADESLCNAVRYGQI